MRALRDIAWEDAAEAPGLDPAIWRIDRACRPMRYDDFERAGALWGWTIRSRDQNDEESDDAIVAIAFVSLCEARGVSISRC